MGFYNLNPDAIRDLQAPDSGNLLSRDGSNIASVVEKISKHNESNLTLIREHLSKIVPSVHDVERKTVGPRQTLEFRQDVAGSRHPWRFLAAYMSDDTLRALGVLVALFQSGDNSVQNAHLLSCKRRFFTDLFNNEFYRWRFNPIPAVRITHFRKQGMITFYQRPGVG
jgi:hypothetical protein